MYVACRDLKVTGGKIIKSGQPIPEAKSWHLSVIRANIDLEWIKEVPDLVEEQVPPTTQQFDGVNPVSAIPQTVEEVSNSQKFNNKNQNSKNRHRR